ETVVAGIAGAGLNDDANEIVVRIVSRLLAQVPWQPLHRRRLSQARPVIQSAPTHVRVAEVDVFQRVAWRLVQPGTLALVRSGRVAVRFAPDRATVHADWRTHAAWLPGGAGRTAGRARPSRVARPG